MNEAEIAALKKVVHQRLLKKEPPADVFRDMCHQGHSSEDVLKVFEAVIHTRASKLLAYYSDLKFFLHGQEQINYNVKSVDELWDPVHRHLWRGMYAVQDRDLRHFMDDFADDPYGPLRRIFVFALIPLGLIVVLAFPVFRQSLIEIFNDYGPLPYITALLIFLFPLIYHIYELKKWKKHLTLMLIGREQGWESFYQSIEKHWDQMQSVYPEVFFQGTERRSVSHQMWGKVEGRDFWFGEFRYASTPMERKKYVEIDTFVHHVFILHLPQRLEYKFFWKGGDFVFLNEQSISINDFLQREDLGDFPDIFDDFRSQHEDAWLFVEKDIAIAVYDGEIFPELGEGLLWKFAPSKYDKAQVDELLHSLDCFLS